MTRVFRLRSLFVICSALAAAVSLADRPSAEDAVNLSPVSVHGTAPALRVDAVVRRVDI